MSKSPTFEVEYIPPRLVVVKVTGYLEAAGATEAMDQVQRHIGDQPFFLMETQVHDLMGVAAEARRIVADRYRVLPKRSIVIVGGKFTQRVVAKLVLTAIMRFGKGETKARTSAFDRSEDARKWLYESVADWEKELELDGSST